MKRNVHPQPHCPSTHDLEHVSALLPADSAARGMCTQVHVLRHQITTSNMVLILLMSDGRERGPPGQGTGPGLLGTACSARTLSGREGAWSQKGRPPHGPTCITNSLRRGRPRSVRSRYSGSFSFFACWIWASLLIGFIPWLQSVLPCS